MTGAEAFVEALKKAGIRYLFGLPGSTEAPTLDALANARTPEYILTLHENTAVGMADGYARATGKAAVASLHTSVGTFNGLNNIYNAMRDNSPVVVTVGHKDSRILSRDGFCVLPDLPGMARQFTKWSWQSMHADQIVPDLYRAIKTAEAAPQGPVYLAIPEDLQAKPLDKPVQEAVGLTTISSAARPERDAVARAAKLLLEAKRPLLVAGRETSYPQAMARLERLAEALSAPVLHEQRRSRSTLNFRSDHPNYVGAYEPDSPVVQAADVIFFAGGQVFLEFDHKVEPELPPGAKAIHLHPSPWELAKLYPMEVALVGDVGEGLQDLLEALQGELVADPQAGSQNLPALRQKYLAEEEKMAQKPLVEDGIPLSGAFLARKMKEVFPRDTIIVDEGMRTSRPLLAHYPFTVPGTYYRSGGGGLGWGISAALGISLACPGKKVVALVGDGAALIGIQALWTAARYNIPVLVVIANNRHYLSVRSAVENFKGKSVALQKFVGSDLSQTPADFVKLAEGFGVPARAVASPEELSPALAEGLSREGPYLLEVPIKLPQ